VKKSIVIAGIIFLMLMVSSLAAQNLSGNVTGNKTLNTKVDNSDLNNTVIVTSITPAANATVNGVCTPTNNLVTRGFEGFRGATTWLVTRDYASAITNIWTKLMGLSIAAKVLVVFAIIIIIFLIWNYNFRNTRANNLKWARYHHRKGEKAHAAGDDESAKEHYDKAGEFRQKAQDQW
jgi:hypothetical protein